MVMRGTLFEGFVRADFGEKTDGNYRFSGWQSIRLGYNPWLQISGLQDQSDVTFRVYVTVIWTCISASREVAPTKARCKYNEYTALILQLRVDRQRKTSMRHQQANKSGQL